MPLTTREVDDRLGERIKAGTLTEQGRRLELANPDFEVVLLEAPTKDDLRRTHGRYFEDLTDLLHPA